MVQMKKKPILYVQYLMRISDNYEHLQTSRTGKKRSNVYDKTLAENVSIGTET